jgi:hypothetical protein
LVFLPKRLGKLRVLVDTTVAPSRTWAWLPMHSEQPGVIWQDDRIVLTFKT